MATLTLVLPGFLRSFGDVPYYYIQIYNQPGADSIHLP